MLLRKKDKKKSGETGLAAELVAVIAAAVAAESGLPPGSFRLASIDAAGWEPGFNTPVWGRVERYTRA